MCGSGSGKWCTTRKKSRHFLTRRRIADVSLLLISGLINVDKPKPPKDNQPQPPKQIPKPFRSPLAYENPGFIHSPDGRTLRMLAEYWEPLGRFRKERIQDTVVFFGSARFASLHTAQQQMALLEKSGSVKLAPAEEQPGGLG